MYKGLNNCPNCLRIVLEREGQDSKSDFKDKQERNSQIFKIQQELEKANDSVKELTDIIEHQREQYVGEHVLLKSEIDRLKALVKEKDLAIDAYKNAITGLNEKKYSVGKILVLGNQSLPPGEIEEICHSINIPFEMIELMNDYSKIKNFVGKVIRCISSSVYAWINNIRMVKR